MSPTSSLLVLGLSIVLIVVMISRAHYTPFCCPGRASWWSGWAPACNRRSSAPSKKAWAAPGFLAGIIRLGDILGKLLEESGGWRIATTLLGWCGERHAHWAMMRDRFHRRHPGVLRSRLRAACPHVVARQTG
jgi:GntP family gluconate:H+ symporter/D-serine transporter